MNVPGRTQALRVESLEAGYEPGLPIVRGASLTVAPGEIVAILGPNGAGKSTLVKAIAGLVPVSAGRVWLGDADITRTPAHRLVHEGLAFVPQTENVFAALTVAENLELAAALLCPGRSQREERERRLASVYLQFDDLKRQRSLPAGRLSGGQRQMLAVARALMAQPRVLMLDEPSAGLSPRLVGEVFAKLREVRELRPAGGTGGAGGSGGAGGPGAAAVAIVLVEQNVKAALAIAHRGVVLVEGREQLVAPAAELRGDARLAELYLGRVATVAA